MAEFLTPENLADPAFVAAWDDFCDRARAETEKTKPKPKPNLRLVVDNS